MSSPHDDFDRVLAAASPDALELARQLLAEAGIPSLAHGPDFDVAQLGSAAHNVLRRQDLFVPKGEGERARALLREAWGEDSVPRPADID